MLTFTKCPRIKYTPSWIWNADPVAAASSEIVVAIGAPMAILLFPRRPEVIIWLQVKFSPSEKVWVALFAVLEFK